MDAVKFFEELKRMCKNNFSCTGCPALLENVPIPICKLKDTPEDYGMLKIDKLVSFIEKWSSDHPKKTRIQDFYEKHPNAPKINGYPIILPISMGYCGKYGDNTEFCTLCPHFNLEDKECWEMPVK